MELPLVIVLSLIGILLFGAGVAAGMAWADAQRESQPLEIEMLRWERRELMSLLERYTKKLSPIGATGSTNPGGSESNPCAQWMPAATTHSTTSAGQGQGD